MKIRLQWNTGRLYTREGQIIVAQYDQQSGIARFSDKSRMISGSVLLARNMQNEERLKFCILHQYDAGKYEYDSGVGLDRQA